MNPLFPSQNNRELPPSWRTMNPPTSPQKIPLLGGSSLVPIGGPTQQCQVQEVPPVGSLSPAGIGVPPLPWWGAQRPGRAPLSLQSPKPQLATVPAVASFASPPARERRDPVPRSRKFGFLPMMGISQGDGCSLRRANGSCQGKPPLGSSHGTGTGPTAPHPCMVLMGSLKEH